MRNSYTIIGCIALAAVLVLGFGSPSAAGDKDKSEVKMQSLCPIMGNPIDKTVYADYEGKRVYFCCAGCIPKFNEDPAGYIKKMEDEGITIAKAEDHKSGDDHHSHGDDHGHHEDDDHDHGDHDHHDHG